MPNTWRPYRNELDPRIGAVSKDGDQGVFLSI